MECTNALGYVPRWFYGRQYVGWYEKEVLTQLKKVDNAIMARSPGSGNVTSASVNGKSFTFQESQGVDSLTQLASEKDVLLDALDACRGIFNGPRNRSIAVQRLPFYGMPNACHGW
jgi:hypothetical protein